MSRRPFEFFRSAAAVGFLRLAWIAGWIAVVARAEDFTFFEQTIRPVLVEQCYDCHSARAGTVKGGLWLDTREGIRRGGVSGQPAVVPGQPEKSRLMEAIRYINHEAPVAPKVRLNERQVSDFITWIQQGAPDPRGDAVAAVPGAGAPHWAFQAVRRPTIPSVQASHWVQSPVDAFILAALEAKGISPAPPADRRTLLRRASYDLTGLPPTPAEIEAFEHDPSTDAFARVVERLLASPSYGERWGRHWLDVVRYADARDLIQLPVESDFREAWRYRDWVVDAHNRDLPYAEFIRRQIAGDLLQPSDPERLDADALVATGMLALADFVPGDVDKEQMIADYVNDQIDVLGRAFLGLTLGCARCHDHKFDPVTIRDYYAMAGIFFSTRLIPSPVLGNTPLVKVPLLPKAELTRIEARKKRVAELDGQIRQLQTDAELEYLSALERFTTEETGRYLLATWKFQHQSATSKSPAVDDFARLLKVSPRILTQWLDYFGLREYPPCVSLADHQDGVAGLVRWTRGTNSLPVARLNTRSNSVEHLGVTYPPGSLGLAPGKTSGLVVSWTSPLLGTVRWSGRLTSIKAAGSKRITAALDLHTPAGRRELATLTIADGSDVDLEKSPGRVGPAVAVRPGDRLELVVMASGDSTPTGLLDWTLTEVDGPRSWSAGRDLVRVPKMDTPTPPLAELAASTAVWRIQETGDVRRRAGEPVEVRDTWVAWRQCLAEAATRGADLTKAQQAAQETQAALAGFRRQQTAELDAAPAGTPDLLRGELLKLQATDPRLRKGGDGRVAIWPNRARSLARLASVAGGATGPVRTNVVVDGLQRPVLRFTGNELMELPLAAPAAGTLFAVFRAADPAAGGQRMVGWEDAESGRHGLGLMLTAGGGLHAILRKDGANGDIVAPAATNRPFELVCLTWGSKGASVFRQGVAVGHSTNLDGISSDPQIKALRLGGPGSGAGGRFQGDLAELRVYSQPLGDQDRGRVEQELRAAWFDPQGSPAPVPSALALVYDDLCSPHGPYWLSESEREEWVPSSVAPQLRQARTERERVLNGIPTNIPQAVVVQDGGPAGTKHEGFKDAPIYLRGNPAKPGEIVPRGFPQFLAGEHQSPITSGSGRRQLADWIADAGNPLTARVAVNRIWQHHFGQGIVRTSTNFGRRGERPTHPELLDYLATRFVESGGSMKAMHRLIMLSSTYQQRSDPESRTLSADPENQLVGRMNRRSLDAESLRDSLLVAAGRLDRHPGGLGFQDISLPRRSLYLMSVRTGAKSGFASVFDGPDGSAVVERRTVSTVAPQALFLLNDPFTIDQASALARRITQESASGPEAQIRAAYRLVLGRAPTEEEFAIGRGLLQPGGSVDPLDRFCQLLLCANEFFYLD